MDKKKTKQIRKEFEELESPNAGSIEKHMQLLKQCEHSKCEKCYLLDELYEQVPKTDRNYWAYTELFVMLHGSDECKNAKN